jgi:hypothetical protein
MSSSENDDAIALYWYYQNQKKRKRRYLVHPYIQNNINCRIFVAANELIQDDVKFQSFYRMSKESFNFLVEKVGPEIEKQDTHFRRCICVRERLLITLR